MHDGAAHRLGKPGERLPSQAEPKTYGDVVAQYRWHPEAKSPGPSGESCGPRTHGLLRRTPVTAEKTFRYIGKRNRSALGAGEDISTLDAEPVDTARMKPQLVCDVEIQRAAQKVTIRKLAKASGVTENTVESRPKGRSGAEINRRENQKGIHQLMISNFSNPGIEKMDEDI